MLTPREEEIMALVAQGLENKEIATRLGISWRTVRNKLDHIYLKLDCRNRTEAVWIMNKERAFAAIDAMPSAS